MLPGTPSNTRTQLPSTRLLSGNAVTPGIYEIPQETQHSIPRCAAWEKGETKKRKIEREEKIKKRKNERKERDNVK